MITNERIIEGFTEEQFCVACSKLSTYITDEDEWHKSRCGLQTRENFSRIHIIGGPGSGKTTLARELHLYLGFEVYELDQIAFTGVNFDERPLIDRIAAIYGIANRPVWITEGLFVRWTDELLARANIIIWLDHVSWEKGIWRIARRFVKSAVGEAKKRQKMEMFTRFPDYFRHVKQFIQVFFSSRAYYTGKSSRPRGRIENRSTTAAFLKPYKNKVIHCYNDESIDALIEYLLYCNEQRRQGKNL